MRATWLATVWQIDWPKSVIISTGNADQIAVQKNLMIQILDSLVSANMNAICFQVRSRCDAMYNSAYEPWSTDLVSYRGQNPGYDPLQFAIDEGHKRGIEVHAWLNPYRYETANGQWTGKAGDYRTSNPNWILSYSSGTCILDPGRPEVQFRIKQIVGDIIQKYDVDGILFDDYFYAYGGTPATLDAATQSLYKPANMDLGNWRRANINKMIAQVYDTIQDIKPYVRFGVAPFGIWTTDNNVSIQEGIPLPGGITGGNMYAEIYCDPVAWLKEGTVDYISPQLYWGTGGSQDYGTLCPWWSKLSNQFGKHFYSSQDIAGLSTSSYAPRQTKLFTQETFQVNDETIDDSGLTILEKRISTEKPMRVSAGNFTQEQIGTQISINRSADENNAPGSIFFSTKQLYQTKGFINYLKKYQFTQKALLPAIDWKQHPDFGLVTGLSITGNVLNWNSSGSNVKYAIYAIPNSKLNTNPKFRTSEYFVNTSFTNSFNIPTSKPSTTFTYAVAVVDKFGNEFAPQIIGQSAGQSISISLTYPNDNQPIIYPFTFSWENNTSIEFYILQIAEDANFTKIVTSRELNQNSLSTSLLDFLKPDKRYYWRVKTRVANAVDGVSAVRSFVSTQFKVASPLNGSVNQSLTPTISWQNIGSGNSYFVELASNNQFSTNSIVYSGNMTATSFQVPAKKLVGQTSYFVRVTTNIDGIPTTTPTISFTTLAAIPLIPNFVSPANNTTVFGTEIKLTWNDDVAGSYRIEMSNEPTFPARNTTIKTIGAYNSDYSFTGLTPSDYYFRIRAEYAGTSYTEWSSTHKISLSSNTDLEFIADNGFTISIKKISNKFEININSQTAEFMDIDLYSISGQKLKTIAQNAKIQTTENHFTVDLNGFNSGIYLLKFRSKTGNNIIKLFK
jgi:uncharacterized lipoprotein YddW (UPF0748 family)